MNTQNLTQDQITEMLVILNDYWQSETEKPKGIVKFEPAVKLLDTYDHYDRLRIALRTESSKDRLMFVDKSLFDSVDTVL